nr:hypothetical protein GCM10020093_031530 [Planobispora longispora]
MRVVMAEDSVLLREGLVGLLERFGHTVAAAVGDAPALVAAVEEHAPDIVVTDVRMPPASSTRACARPSPCAGRVPPSPC